MKDRKLFLFNCKTIFLLALTSMSMVAKADLYITITNSENKVTEEKIETAEHTSLIDESVKTEVASLKALEEGSVKDIVVDQTIEVTTKKEETLAEKQQEVEPEQKQEKQEQLEQEKKLEVQVETHSVVTENSVFKFKQTGLAESKYASITVQYEGQIVSSKSYFSNSLEVVYTAPLAKSYGDYVVEYTEYDNKTAFRKKTKIVRYNVEYKKTTSNYKPKVSSSVQSTNPEIVNLAMDITALAQNEMEKMKAINLWIATNVTYNRARDSYTQKNDAVTSLQKRTAICMGYANLFAALARAAGLETKVMTGKAISNGKKYYHQWNEVRVDGKWYFVDTTWNASTRSGPETFISLANQYPKSHYGAKEVKAL